MLHDSTGPPLTRRHRVRFLGPGLILVMVVAGGCGSNDPWDRHRQAVTGTVTLEGQPLGEGAIRLEPPSPYESGLAVGATVRRGSFAIPRHQGPTPGTYRVRIYSSSGVPAPPTAGQSDRTRPPMVERLPAIYNTNSEMRVDVTAEGSNRFRFELHAAPDP